MQIRTKKIENNHRMLQQKNSKFILGLNTNLRAGRQRRRAHRLQLRVRVGGKAVDGDDHRHAVLAHVLNVPGQVAAALGDQLNVLCFIGMVQRRARNHLQGSVQQQQRR